MTKVESVHPGFTYDFVVGIMRHGELSVNMNESILRLQGAASEADGKLHTFPLLYCMWVNVITNREILNKIKLVFIKVSVDYKRFCKEYLEIDFSGHTWGVPS